MKLRIKGNSLRLRVSRVDLANLLHDGRIDETIQFTPDARAKLTYGLEIRSCDQEISVQYYDCQVRLVLSTKAAMRWANGDEVGLYGESATDSEPLQLSVEKDYACIDRDDADNAEAFPNPKAGTVC
jgi:hypothetical protein